MKINRPSRVELMTLTVALVIGAFQIVTATAAKAADTAVTCKTPFATVNTGQDGSSPRFTIKCTGGSSAGDIIYFAYKISTNPGLAAMLVQTFETYVFQSGDPISIYSNLADQSGDEWGCGGSNCRILDYVSTN